jgi:predicted nucleic acid-binding protein
LRIDLDRSLRRVRPERFARTLARRGDDELAFATDVPLQGFPLLLDTTVYVDGLEGTAPPAVGALLEHRTVSHLDIALGELAHNFGRLDPSHPGTRTVLRELRGAIGDVPRHRVESAAPGTVLEAGILAGLLFRLGRLPGGQEVAALNDATIFLHALEKGYTVLTRNIRDFDLMGQIVPAGRVLFYRRTP